MATIEEHRARRAELASLRATLASIEEQIEVTKLRQQKATYPERIRALDRQLHGMRANRARVIKAIVEAKAFIAATVHDFQLAQRMEAKRVRDERDNIVVVARQPI